MANSKSSSASAGGVSGVGVVQIVFLILKLCKIAPIGNWSWWKVMLPLECSVGLICCLGCCVAGCGAIIFCSEEDNNIIKPGTTLTEEQLRNFEQNLSQEQNRNKKLVDSEATTSPSRHDDKILSINNVAIQVIPEERHGDSLV